MKERGEVHITFTPQTNRKFELEEFFFFNKNQLASITRELKSRIDQEMRKRGINLRNSRLEPDFRNFGLKYYAEYDPPKRYGVAIGPAIQAVIKTVIKAIIQVIKSVVRMVIKAIQAIVKFIQKLIVHIKNIIQIFNQALQKFQTLTFEGSESLNPDNPEAGLSNLEKETEKELSKGTSSENGKNKSSIFPSNIFSSPNSWIVIGGLGALALALAIVLKK